MVKLDEIDLVILNRVQKNFPVCSDPFSVLSKELKLQKYELIERLEKLNSDGVIRRFGGVLNHQKNGASTLAALKVPVDKIDDTAEIVNAFREVNHNYLREHEFNMWFVITAKEQQGVDDVLDALKNTTGFELLILPMIKSHHIDLAFNL